MKTWKSRPVLLIVGVVLLTIVGCSGDSPTEPSKPGSGNPIPPSDSVSITTSVSSQTRESAIVTATIDNGSAADGTAVEFETIRGTFEETGTAYALRSTTGGRASVKVLAAEGFNSTVVRVRVKTTVVEREVKFGEEAPTGAPQIITITPTKGSPSGGYVVSIRGRSFFEPLRVFFGTREAVIASFTAETQTTTAEIKAVVPGIDLGVSKQFEEVSVTVVSRAGTVDEVSGSTALPDKDPETDDGFRYELDIMTPDIYHVSPSSGPNEGNTRITIFGEGFQSPVVAYFGSGSTRVDLPIVSVSYGQIIATTPPALGLGSAFRNQSVSLTVQNVASNKSKSLSSAFRYGPDIQITAVSPTTASYLGGTRVTINGFGFDDPVAVSLAGIAAQVISVSGTEIVAIASAPPIINCAVQGGGDGAVVVTNIEDGSTAEGPDFTYVFNPPVITLIAPVPVTEGNTLNVTVLNPGLGNATFSVGDRTAFPTPSSATNASGETTYQITIPTGLEFDTEDCTSAGGATGTIEVNTDFELAFRNVITGCEATLAGGVTVAPLAPTCDTGPVGTVTPSSIAFPPTTNPAVAGPNVVTIGNIGSANLVILGVTSSSPAFTTTPPLTTTVAPSSTTTFTVSFAPAVGAAAYTGTITVSTNAGNLVVAVTGNGL